MKPPVVAVIILGLIGVWWWTNFRHTQTSSTSSSQSSTTAQRASSTDTKPSFITAAPGEHSVESLGGWTRVSPADGVPAYAFKDTIDGVDIIVTEQSLPDTFRSDVDGKVAELGKSYGATQRIPASGASVYVSHPSKGTQYVIASKYDLLILIKADALISNDSWVGYLSSLH